MIRLSILSGLPGRSGKTNNHKLRDMKPKTSNSFAIFVTFASLMAVPAAKAAIYYWDDNAAGAGFGTAGANIGTWAAPTAGPTAGWSLSGTGADAFASFTTATTDTVNFGNGATGLASGTITVSGTVATGNMTFASGSGAITLSGGKITLGGGRTIIANNNNNVINSELELTGATTISLNLAATSNLTLGVMSGTGGLTLRNTAGTNPNPARFTLNGQSTYTGNTILDSTNANASVELRLGVNNALPTTTVLTIDGGNGTGSGRSIDLNMNGRSQTLGGLTNTAVTLRTQDVFNSSGTLSTLTINDGSNRTFSGRIGAGGTNIAIVKQGGGTWTLSGANTYTGTTEIEEGTITIASNAALGSSAGNTVVSSGARLFVGTTGRSTAEPFNISGAGIGGANGAIHIGGSATGVAFTGAITLAADSTIQSDGNTGTTFSGGIDTGGNALTFNGSGSATINTTGISGLGGSVVKNTGGSLTLNTANSYTGLTTINGGAVVVGHAEALGTTAAGTVVNGTGTGSANNARVDVSGGVTVTGEALTINGVGNFTGALTSSTGTNVWAGDVTIGSAGTRIGASTGASIEVSGVIDSGANPHGLVVRTANTTDATVIFSGANTYLGNTQVLIGKLQLAGGDNRLPVGTSLLFSSSTVNGGAELDLNGRNQEVAGISISGGADVTLNGVNNNSATLSTLTVNTAASPSSHSGYLKGNLALEKTGSDLLTLGGTNSYTGDTTVTNGTLRVNGEHTGGGTYTVGVNGKLQGTGSTTSALNVSGVLSPGASVETFASGTLNQLNGSTFEAELDSSVATTSGADLQIVSGDLNLSGTVALTLADIASLPEAFALGTTFSLINYSGAWNNGLFTFDGDEIADGGEFTAGLNRWQLDYNASEGGLNFDTEYLGGTDSFVNITAVVIPEPSAALLGGLGVMLLLRRHRG